MTPLEALNAGQTRMGVSFLTNQNAVDILVAAGHLTAPDVTIQVTLTPEEADSVVKHWGGSALHSELQDAGRKVRDAILEARDA